MMKRTHRSFDSRRLPGPMLLLAVCAGVLLAGPALAQVYTWTDENGVVHYSDTPNAAGPSEELAGTEIYRPGSADAYPSTPAAADDTSGPATDAASPTADTSPAAQIRADIAERAAERRQQEAETERLCALNRQRLEQLEPARRAFYVDSQGNEVRMDDDERVALIEESKAYISANCKP